jgi:hypothetical protein
MNLPAIHLNNSIGAHHPMNQQLWSLDELLGQEVVALRELGGRVLYRYLLLVYRRKKIGPAKLGMRIPQAVWSLQRKI